MKAYLKDRGWVWAAVATMLLMAWHIGLHETQAPREKPIDVRW